MMIMLPVHAPPPVCHEEEQQLLIVHLNPIMHGRQHGWLLGPLGVQGSSIELNKSHDNLPSPPLPRAREYIGLLPTHDFLHNL